MSDSLTAEKRSWNMSRIKGRDTKIEVMVRKYLFAHGYRFRKNDRRYPGKPDVVLPKYRTVIFINGCFWHRHEGCRQATIPKTRTEFWINKLNQNVKNDIKNKLQMESMGWHVITLWECELEKDFETRMNMLLNEISDRSKEDNYNGDGPIDN